MLYFDKNSTPYEVIQLNFNEILSKYEDYDVFFINGSKTTAGAGCAFVINLSDAIRYSLPSIFSVFSTKLYAIKLAVDLAREGNKRRSLSTIRAHSSSHRNKRHTLLNDMLYNILNSINRIHISWVPGYVGSQKTS